MDLETENRIAAILLKEAAELRRQAEEEGVLGYLRKPNVRGRPNSRFLTATVLGVQQANRAVEENEMWRSRQKELELDTRIRGRSREASSSGGYYKDISDSEGSGSKRHAVSRSDSSSSLLKKRVSDNGYLRENEGFRDNEVEEFLHSRVKRGRGEVGSRMDETGPYLPSCPDSTEKRSTAAEMERWKSQGSRVILGPEKPSLLMAHDTSEDEYPLDKKKKPKKIGSSKEHTEKHKSKGKSKDKKRKKKREEKRHKHRKN